MSQETDVVIIGAGAAGLMCAIEAGKRGRRVLVLDHAAKPAEKIRISGGGRCNFTNLATAPDRFLSQNPRFAASALSRYTALDFVHLVEKHGIAYHEKAPGQLFCDRSAQQIIDMLLRECREANVDIRLKTAVERVSKTGTGFELRTAAGEIAGQSLVVACGGLSIPKMGATGFGYELARQFGLRIVAPRAGLVPLTLTESDLRSWRDLTGVAVRAEVRLGKVSFEDGLLFTHRGLSGPAILQISSYWEPKQPVLIDLLPGVDAAARLKAAKKSEPRQETATALGTLLPKRLAQRVAEHHSIPTGSPRLADAPDKHLEQLGSAINRWELLPNGTEGYRTAEVTLGGVDTAELSSRTMEARQVPNLYFIGEVVDVTGHLGGFNFQWAWASGVAAGQCA